MCGNMRCCSWPGIGAFIGGYLGPVIQRTIPGKNHADSGGARRDHTDGVVVVEVSFVVVGRNSCEQVPSLGNSYWNRAARAVKMAGLPRRGSSAPLSTRWVVPVPTAHEANIGHSNGWLRTMKGVPTMAERTKLIAELALFW